MDALGANAPAALPNVAVRTAEQIAFHHRLSQAGRNGYGAGGGEATAWDERLVGDIAVAPVGRLLDPGAAD